MKFIFAFIFILLFICSVFFRVIITHPICSVLYSLRDIFNFFRFRLWRKAECGHLDCYAAHFGGGKTLSMAHYIDWYNHRYNNKRYYDISRKKWLIQRVIVLSNFSVNGVDCVPLKSLSDVVAFSKVQKEYDEEHGTRTLCLVAIDEASCQLNSRNFKSNIDPLFLNTLITCRHYNINFIYSSQKFKLTDALLRSVTQNVIVCKKIWRVMEMRFYDADVVELATDTSLIKPKRKRGWFIRNKHFNLYDTLSCVDNLTKDESMLSYDEILANLGGNNCDDDRIYSPSNKLRSIRKKRAR